MLRQPIVAVLGHVDHGKCVTPQTMLVLANNKLAKAEDVYNEFADGGDFQEIDGYKVTEIENGPEVFSLNDNEVTKKRITHMWKIKSPKKLIKIKLKSGDDIETTFEHPFFVLNDKGEIVKIKSEDIKEGDFIVVPQKLNFGSDIKEIKKILFNRIAKAEDFVLFVDDNCRLIERLKNEVIYRMEKGGIFSTNPNTCIKNRRFRSRDYAKLCGYFGFSDEEAYDMIKYMKNSSKKWRAGHTSNKMRLPKMNEDFRKLGYVLGCMAGNGHVNSGILNNNDASIQGIYQSYVNDVFGLETRVKQGHTCQIVKTNGGLTFVRFLTDIIGFPSSEKSSKVDIPEILHQDFETIKTFIRGWFDTDGYVSHLNNTIEITSKSRNLVKQASVFLLGNGIHSAIFEKNGFWYLRIGSYPYLERFILHIGSDCEFKKNRLADAVNKASTSRVFDLTPLSGSILSEIKIGRADEKIAYFTRYRTYKNLSRPFLRQLNRISEIEKTKNLNHIISNEISFVKVISKTVTDAKSEFVYDFTVEDTHNFVAERIFVHNTSLLDAIRKTALAAKEAGGITQAIGSTEMPRSTIEEISGQLLKKFKFSVEVPGLLFIDTPGHEAFTTLRRRGGSIADIAILVVDINEGIMPQTEESIQILKDAKTPFLVAMTKIDRIEGWRSERGSFSYETQSDAAKGEFEKKFYAVAEQFRSRGFQVERFDRVSDFSTTVAAVPLSPKTGEGIDGLLAVLIGLSQQFLKKQLEKTENAAGTILEVKDVTGLGKTLDVIIYDGAVRKNDFLVIGGPLPRITRIRALLMPSALRDMRTEKRFTPVEECSAACGVKIAAPGIDDVVAGVEVRSAKTMEQAERFLDAMEKEREETEVHAERDGLVLKADTVGSLEALLAIFKAHPVREASIGAITKQDVIKAEANKDATLRVVVGFNARPGSEAEALAKDRGISVMTSDVIYRLKEGYEKWAEERREAMRASAIEGVTRPAKLRLLPGFVFRASSPAIVGCEIVAGVLQPEAALFKASDSLRGVGSVKQIQSQGENVSEAKAGDRVAVSISGPTVGRHISEGDTLYTDVSSEEYKKLRDNAQLISESEKRVLDEILALKRKHDPRYGF